MKLEFVLTFSDYKAGQRLYHRQTLGRKLRFAFWNIVIPVLAAIGLVVFVYLAVSHITRHMGMLLGIECALLWITIYYPIAGRRKMRKDFEHLYPAARTDEASAIEIDDDHLLCGIPGVNEVKFFWNAIVDFAQDDWVTLIYVAKDRFFLFPTSAMSPDQRVELNNFISRHIAKGPPC